MDKKPQYCPDCGAPIKEGASFCGKCGTKVAANTKHMAGEDFPVSPKPVTSESPVMPSASSANTSNGNVREKVGTSIDSKQVSAKACEAKAKFEGLDKKKQYGIIAGIAVIILALIFALKPSSINLNDYMTVKFDGYNGYGIASIDFDEDRFTQDITGKIKLQKEDEEEFQAIAKHFGVTDKAALDAERASMVAYDVKEKLVSKATLDPEKGLSNGQEVKLVTNVDMAEFTDRYGFKLKYSDVTKTVKGLDDVETYDPFAGVDITFKGTSENPSLEVTRPKDADDDSKTTEFYIHAKTVNNGDEVEVSCVPLGEDEQEYLSTRASNGLKVPSPVSKTFKVTGIRDYVATQDQLSEKALKQLQKEATDQIDAALANRPDSCTLNEKTYLGDYIMSRKPDRGRRSKGDHVVVLVYKLNANYEYDTFLEKGSKNDVTSYVAVKFPYCAVDDQDNAFHQLPVLEASRFAIGGKSFAYATGYKSLNELYQVTVGFYTDEYNHEDNVSE